MYKLEADFSEAFIAKLKRCGLKHTRFESHGTAVGIPDMFVQGGGDDWWIELKNKNTISISKEDFTIPFRPGQEAWHITYNLCHVTKCSWVFMSVRDGVIAIRMRHDGRDAYRFTWEQWSKVNLYTFLKTYTYN